VTDTQTDSHVAIANAAPTHSVSVGLYASSSLQLGKRYKETESRINSELIRKYNATAACLSDIGIKISVMVEGLEERKCGDC